MKHLVLLIILCVSVHSYADERTKLHIAAGLLCQSAADLMISKGLHLEGNQRYYSLLISAPLCNLVSLATEAQQAQERNKPFDAGDHGAFALGQLLGVGLKIGLDF